MTHKQKDDAVADSVAGSRGVGLAVVAPRRLPPMHAITAFEAAARLGTFAQAAEELCVTQSAISHRIRLLEEHVGAPMFARVHKHVVLTAQGERFLTGVREAMRHLGTAAASLGGSVQSKLRITSAPALASQILIPHLRTLLTRHEDLQLEIDTSTRLVDLRDGSYDLGLRFGAGPWPGLEHELLLNESVLALASPDYASSFGPRRTRTDLGRAKPIHSSAFSWQNWWKSIGEPVPRGHASELTFPEVSAALDAAVHGLGVVLSNRLSSLDLRRRGLLVPFVDETVDLHRHYYAVYRADSPRLETIRAFIDWLLPCIASACKGSAAGAAKRSAAS